MMMMPHTQQRHLKVAMRIYHVVGGGFGGCHAALKDFLMLYM